MSHIAKSNLTQAHLLHIWMPNTGNRQFKKIPRIITSLLASLLYGTSTRRKIFRRFILAMDLWTWTQRSCYQRSALLEQVKRSTYSPCLSNMAWEVVFTAERKSLNFMPAGLNRISFGLRVPSRVDTALKVAAHIGVKKALGTKTKFIGRAKGLSCASVFWFQLSAVFRRTHLIRQGLESYQFYRTTQVPGTEFN